MKKSRNDQIMDVRFSPLTFY